MTREARRLGTTSRRRLLGALAGVSSAVAGCAVASMTEPPEAPDTDLLADDADSEKSMASDDIPVFESDSGPLEDVEVDAVPALLVIKTGQDKGLHVVNDA